MLRSIQDAPSAQALDELVERAPVRPQRGRRAVVQDPRSRTALVIAVPALLAAALSWYAIAGRSLGFDEAATVTIASQHGAALWVAIAHDGGNMSGYYLVLHLLIGALGNGLGVIRLASAVAATATAGLIAALGVKLYDRRIGLIAGVLGAVSLSLVFWAQNARGYAPMVAFVCAAFLAFAGLVEPGTSEDGRGGAWCALVAFLALGAYSSFVAVLAVPVMAAVVVLVRRRLWRRFVVAMAALGLTCLPLVVLAVHRGPGQLFWVPRPSFMTETQVLQTITSAGMEPSFHRTPTTTGLMLATLALLLAITGSIVWRAAGHGARSQWAGLLLVGWLLGPLVLAWAASFVIQPIFVARNLLVSVPPVALLLAVGLADRRVPGGRVSPGLGDGPRSGLGDGPRSGLGGRPASRLGGRPASRLAGRGLASTLGLALLVVLLGLRAEQVVAAYGVSPEQWRQSAAFVLARSRPGDCIAFYPEDARMAFQYYLGAAGRSDPPRSILPAAGWGRARPYVEDYATLSPARITAAARGCRRLWLVASHEGQSTGPLQSQVNRRRFEQLRLALERVFGAAPVTRFGYAAAIHVQLLPGATLP